MVIVKSLSVDSSSYPSPRIVLMKLPFGEKRNSPTPLPLLNKPLKATVPASRCMLNCAFAPAFGLSPLKSPNGKSELDCQLRFPSLEFDVSESHSTVPLVVVSFTFAVQSPVMLSCAAIDGLVKPYDDSAAAAINVI